MYDVAASLLRFASQRQRNSRVFLTFSLLAMARPAQAALLDTCRPTDSAFVCRLRSVLTLLQTAAGILALLLIVAVLAAVRAYRRKPRIIAPEDITSDAK